QEENEYIYISCTNRDGTFYRPFYDKDYAVKNDVLKKIKLTLNKTINDLNKNNITTTKVKKRKRQ
ncbi:MAG: hypothetical protein K6G64_08440, partial [Eubacterium sp.]|nr:hypothetical protein [Eubacterium sp.]